MTEPLETNDRPRPIASRASPPPWKASNAFPSRSAARSTGAFARGVASGKSFETTLRGIGQRFVDIALSAALKPAQSLVGGLLSGLAGSLGSVRPFADGGVVGAPTYFPMARQIGLMGEAGPEAVMPLARGPDGRLGVRGGGGGGDDRQRHDRRRRTPRASAAPRRRSPRASPAPSARGQRSL